jgi:guanylate kinase
MENIIIISGPSGAGEDSVIDGLEKELALERVITTTTRKPRSGESQGHPYYFTSREDFERRIAAGEFLEYAEEYNHQLYGVTKEELERVNRSGRLGIWKIEYQGVESAKKLFPTMLAILITAPLEVMEDRIRRRGNLSEEDIRERIAYTKTWLEQHTDAYDYHVENQEGKLDQTIATLKSFIESKR